MKRNYLWKILIGLGTVPFLAALCGALWAAIDGFAAFYNPPYYGWEAFHDWIILYSFLAWPSYLVGLILIIFSVIMLRRNRRTTQNLNS